VLDDTDDGLLKRECVEAEELGRLGRRPVLIAEARGRPAELVDESVEGVRAVRLITLGRGAGVGVDSGEGVGDGARRSDVWFGRFESAERSREDEEAERPAAARVSFC
jgi:hypothetical protein